MEKSKLKIFNPKRVVEVGIGTDPVGPRTQIEVVASPLGNLYVNGYKCEHGVYIPATSSDPNRAPFCTVCHPVLLNLREAS